jgi:hypothetical protein
VLKLNRQAFPRTHGRKLPLEVGKTVCCHSVQKLLNRINVNCVAYLSLGSVINDIDMEEQ